MLTLSDSVDTSSVAEHCLMLAALTRLPCWPCPALPAVAKVAAVLVVRGLLVVGGAAGAWPSVPAVPVLLAVADEVKIWPLLVLPVGVLLFGGAVSSPATVGTVMPGQVL